jgi:hypothetical protein
MSARKVSGHLDSQNKQKTIVKPACQPGKFVY